MSLRGVVKRGTLASSRSCGRRAWPLSSSSSSST